MGQRVDTSELKIVTDQILLSERDGLQVYYVSPGSGLYEEALNAVAYAYHDMYATEGVSLESVRDEFADNPYNGRSSVFVATRASTEGLLKLVSSVRLVIADPSDSEQQLEVEELFSLKNGEKWPHYEDDKIAGELGRFLVMPEYRGDFKNAIGSIYEAATKHFKDLGGRHLLSVMPRHVLAALRPPRINSRVFDGKSGLPKAIINNQSTLVQRLQKDFANYWKPEDPKNQAKVYEFVDWEEYSVPEEK